MTVRTLVGLASLVLLLQVPSAKAQAPLKAGPGVADPTVVSDVQPRYTPEAMRAKIEGVVGLEVVILKDGTVGDVKVLNSLDDVYGLDQAAVDAARRWKFQPARTKADNQPVDYLATIEMSFRIVNEFEQALPPDTPGLVAPRALTTVAPEYTDAARAARIQGSVEVEAVVLPNGKVSAARVRRPLSPSPQAGFSSFSALEGQAVAAAKQWTFEPATLNGRPVRALVTIALEFRLR